MDTNLLEFNAPAVSFKGPLKASIAMLLISVVNHIYDQKYNGAGSEKLKRILKRTPSNPGLPHFNQW